MHPSIIIGVAFVSAALLLALLEPTAKKYGLVDVPGGRKAHLLATPDHGGIAIFFATLIAVVASDTLLENYWPLLLTAFFVLSIGVIDDLYDINAKSRMLLHASIAAVLIVLTDTRISSLGNLFGFGDLQLYWLSYPFTIFCFLAGINAINMIDGIDGLAGGLVLIPLGLIAAVCFLYGDANLAFFATVVCGALLAFLLSNYRFPGRKRARAFLGDSGSTTLGFMFVWFLIEATQQEANPLPPVVALWLLAIPLVDSGCVILMRWKQGRSILSAGRDHVHHRLMKMGCSVTKTAIILHVASVSFCFFGLACYYTGVQDWLLFCLIIGLFAVNLYAGTRFLTLISDNELLTPAPLRVEPPLSMVIEKDQELPSATSLSKREGQKAA